MTTAAVSSKSDHGTPGGFGVHQVVEGKFPPVQLTGVGDSARGARRRNVEGALLVRVLPVPEPRHPAEAQVKLVRQAAAVF